MVFLYVGEEKTKENLQVKQFLEEMANVQKLSGSLKQTAALGYEPSSV